MSIKITTGSDSFEPIDEGVWESDLVHMEERNELNNYTNQSRDVIRCSFKITEGEMKGRIAFLSVTPNISVKSKLFAICKAIMGREFTPEELAGIAEEGLPLLESFIGVTGCLKILVKHKVSARGNTYYIVSDFLKSVRKEREFPYIPHDQNPDDQGGEQPPHPADQPAKVEEDDNEFPPKDDAASESPKSAKEIAETLDAEEENETVSKATPKNAKAN